MSMFTLMCLVSVWKRMADESNCDCANQERQRQNKTKIIVSNVFNTARDIDVQPTLIRFG